MPRNEADLLVSLGRLSEAQRTVSEALRVTEEGDEKEILYSHCYRGWVGALAGQLRPAALDFALANALENKMNPVGDGLYSLRGIRWAELLVRCGHPGLASRRTNANLRVCERERNRWNHDIARCHSMLGWCALIAFLGDA